MLYTNKVIWITGASSGIGQELALQFAKEKATLVLSSRNLSRLNEVKLECEKRGSVCHVFPLDLTIEKNINETAKQVLEKVKKIDLLINNGGISQRSFALETPVDVDRKVMETNFFGAVTLTKSVLPSMVANGGGHIVAISSIVGKFGFPLRSAYSASKHALHGFFDTIRAELYSKNIQVTLVIPGRIRTNISVNAIDKEGKAYGVMDEGQSAGMPVNQCVRKIIKGLKKNKKEILVGKSETLMVHIRKFLPGLYYKLARKVSPT